MGRAGAATSAGVGGETRWVNNELCRAAGTRAPRAPTELSAARRPISEAWLVTMRPGSRRRPGRAGYVTGPTRVTSPLQ